MAKLQDLPPSYQRVNTGIRLGVYPSSDPLCGIELQRAVAGSTATFVSVTRMYPSAGQSIFQYDDRLPDDGVTRYYKAKSVRDGYTDSAFTPVVSAKPSQLLVNLVATPPLSGASLQTDVFLSTAKRLSYGTAAVPRVRSKVLMFGGAGFLSATSSAHVRYSTASAPVSYGYVVWPTTTIRVVALYPFHMPTGSRLRSIQANLIRKGANSTAKLELVRWIIGGSSSKILTTINSSAGNPGGVQLTGVIANTDSTVREFDGLAFRLTLKSSANSTHSGCAGIVLLYDSPYVDTNL